MYLSYLKDWSIMHLHFTYFTSNAYCESDVAGRFKIQFLCS